MIDAAANPSVLAGVNGQSSTRQLFEHNLASLVNILEYCKTQAAGLLLLSSSRVYSIEALAALPLRVEDSAFVLDTTRDLPVGTSPDWHRTRLFHAGSDLSLWQHQTGFRRRWLLNTA